MKVYNLQINHLTSPVGIDGTHVRVSWNVADALSQSAFQVTVTGENGDMLEDSHKTASTSMAYLLQSPLAYKGKYVISVRAWDESDTASEAETATVITGIDKAQWAAHWINPEPENAAGMDSGTQPQNSADAGSNTQTQNAYNGNSTDERKRASYLMKDFSLTEEQVNAAKAHGAYLYATCHGLMNIYINDEEITDHQLMPGTQQYDKRLMVETLPVADFLQAGENTIVVTLGDGWWRGSMGHGQERNIYGADVALLAQLEIAKSPVLTTDETWQATQDGPLGKNDFMAGEEYDATKSGRDGMHAVAVADFGYDNLICVDTVPITPHETFTAKWLDAPNGEKVLDFGQNLVGYVAFDFEGEADRQMTLTHGEVLDKDGNFTIANFQNPKIPTKQEIHYVCKDGRNAYHPTKTYMGFRYVKVEADFEVRPEWFTAVMIYSDMKTTAEFDCGVEEVNQLFKNALWSMKGNFVDVPTDCPQREKSGYSGDCQAFIHTAMYLMDCYPVYAKWLREQASAQYEDGSIPQIAPKCSTPGEKQMMMGMISMDDGIGWCDSFEIVPYRLMKRYGDDGLVRENYEALKKWTEYEINRAAQTRPTNMDKLPEGHRDYMIDTGWMWGEWLEPGQDDDGGVAYMSNLMMNGDPEVGTAFFYLHLSYMEQMAEKLGKDEDASYYHDLAEKAKAAYRAVYTKDGKIIEEKRQCRFVRPIAHGLLSEEEMMQAAADLAEKIQENGTHLGTGFLTTHELCRSLSRNGQNKTAYDLLLQKEKPGWLYAVKKGCTTIPESWDCFDEEGQPRNSFNHYSYGAVVGWLFDCACGIVVENGEIRIQPCPDERLGHATAVYHSPYGKIVSGWKYEDGKCTYEVEIPANMEAMVMLPGRDTVHVTAGHHTYK